MSAEPPADIRAAQDDIRWAEHVVLIYPLWLGTMPALLKGISGAAPAAGLRRS